MKFVENDLRCVPRQLQALEHWELACCAIWQPCSRILCTAMQESGAEAPSSVGVGLSVIKQGVPLPTPPKGQSYRPLKGYRKVSLCQQTMITATASAPRQYAQQL